MKRNIVIAAVTTVALIGGGTATALAVSGGDDGHRHGSDDRQARHSATTTDDDGPGRASATGTGDDTARTAAARVRAAEAIEAALARVPGTAVSAELDDDDDHGGATVWDVDVLAADGTWHSVDVDAATGSVRGTHVEDEGADDTAETRRALAGTSVSAAEAARAADVHATVTSVELDDDGSDRAWEIETRTATGAERDQRVDLNTGKVTADRSDDTGAHDGDDGDDDHGGDRHGRGSDDGRHGDDDDHGRHGGDDD